MPGERRTPYPPGLDSQRPVQVAWRFGAFELDVPERQLTRAGGVVALTPLLLSVLSYLIHHRDRLVTREELVAAIWKGVRVGEGSLRQAIWELRQKLGDEDTGRPIIQTLRGRGYRFSAPVEPVLSQVQSPPGSADVAASASGGSDSGPARGLFGRADELARLSLMLRDARGQGGRACAIVGPAGVGKSRLARALTHDSTRAAQPFVEGHADANGGAPPFWPWLQMISAYVQGRPESRSRHVELAPAVFRLLSGTAALSLTPSAEASLQQRFALLAEMGQLFVALANEQPGILLLEDLQWADEGSLAFLTHFLPLLSRTRSLLVVTCRVVRPRDERAVARALRELMRTPWSEQIELRNLTAPTIAQMLAAHAGAAVPETLCDQVFEISRGNPLFANELARLLTRPPAHGHAQPALGLSEIHTVIQRRLETLPDEASMLARAASVLSPDFTLAELAGVLREPSTTTLTRLDSCLEQEIFAEGPEGRIRFAHPLLREAAYALLPRERRCQLHRSAGEWLESHGAESQVTRLSELARHFVAAAPDGCARKAVHYATLYAAFAYESTAYADAVSYYEQALACADLDPTIEPELYLELELQRGEAQRAAGVAVDRVNAHFLQLARRAEVLRNPELFARAVLGYAGQRSLRLTPTRFPAGSHADQVALLEKALAGLSPESHELRALLLCSLTAALLHTPERARREGAVEEALQIAHRLDAPWLKARALATQVYCCAAPNARNARLSQCDLLVLVTRTHMLIAQETDALMTRAILHLGDGSAREADADVARARHLASTLHLPQVRSRCALVELMQAFWSADLPRAKQLTEQALAANPEDTLERVFFMLRMATLDTLTHGLRAQTIALYENWLIEHPHALAIHAVLASVYASLGQVEIAERFFDGAAQDDFERLPEDITWISSMTALADAARRLDDRERASLIYRRLVPHGHQFDFFAGEAAPAGPVAFWLAQLAITLGDYDRAQDWLEVADDINARLGATLFQQLANLCRVRLLLRRGASGGHKAHALLSEARSFAARTGVGLLRIAVQEVEQEIARTHSESAAKVS